MDEYMQFTTWHVAAWRRVVFHRNTLYCSKNNIQLCLHTVWIYSSKRMFKSLKCDILWTNTFDNNRNVKGCRWNSVNNLYPGIMIRSSFWKFPPKNLLGKRVKSFIDFFVAYLLLIKTCNLALFLPMCKGSIHSVQK